MFTVHETKVGRTSRVNRIEFSAERAASFVEDYGLDVPVPGYDQDNAPKNYDPKGRAVEGATNLILLDREIRVAELFRNPANYAYKQTLSAGSYIDDPNSHPVELILEAKKDMIAGADSLVLGMDVWTKLRLHPRVVAACQGNSGTSGVASRERLADLLEVYEIIVGNSKHNVNKRGQSPQIVPTWAGFMGLFRTDDTADTENGTTFSLTARFGDRVAGVIEDPNMGLRGGEIVRVGESVKELAPAPHCGYFFENALNPGA